MLLVEVTVEMSAILQVNGSDFQEVQDGRKIARRKKICPVKQALRAAI